MNGIVQICYRCQESTEYPVEIAVIHAASGPGRTLWACPDCAAPAAVKVTPPAAALAESLRRGACKGTP